MNEFFTNAVKSFKKNPAMTLAMVVMAVVLIFIASHVYNHIPGRIDRLEQKIDSNHKELNEKINQNQIELIEKMNSNQHEIKDLIIKHLIEKK